MWNRCDFGVESAERQLRGNGRDAAVTRMLAVAAGDVLWFSQVKIQPWAGCGFAKIYI